jgi:hypothetical protein
MIRTTTAGWTTRPHHGRVCNRWLEPRKSSSKAMTSWIRLAIPGVFVLLPCCGARTPLNLDLELPADVVDSGVVGCTPGTVALKRANPAVMFVLDRSKSMSDALDATSGSESRWDGLTTALSSALPAIDDAAEIGALVFPSDTSDGQASCSVSTTANLAPQTGHVASLISLMQATTPGGATPTAVAIDAAAQILSAVRAASTARAMILATDGGPDCNSALDPSTCRCVSSSCSAGTRCLDDARTIERITYHAAQGMPTYVIGIQTQGDTEFTDVLDAMAVAGGRPQQGVAERYYAASSEADLQAALVAIRNQVGSCIFLTTSVPGDGGTISLKLDGADVSEQEWAWGSKNNGEVVLTGAACAMMTADTGAVLAADVECGDE